MEDYIRTQLSKLVSFKTIEDKPEEFKKCLEYIKSQLSFYPFKISEYESNGKLSLVATTTDTKKPTIFLNAHIDVVPASSSAFTLVHNGDKVFGRGVYDMKFAVPVFLLALKNMYQKTRKLPNIGLMFTTEEEVEGNNGPGFLLNKKGYSCDLAFIPDGGDNWHIATEAKGVLVLKLAIPGKSAHASTPWMGESAITKLFAYGQKLETLFPNPTSSNAWKTTVNFGKVQGGKALNQVSDKVELFLDFRYTPDTSEEEIKETILKELPGVQIEVADHVPAFSVDENNKYVQKWKTLISQQQKGEVFMKETGATDGPFFSEHKIPTIVSKPIGGGFHSEHEWLSISSAVEYTKLLEKFLLDF